MTTVYAKIVSAKHAPWLVGCGAWGCGESKEEALRVAKREVRSAYGPGVKVEVVRVEEE